MRSEPFVLVPHTVTDLADFAANHGRYLVSMYAESERAAAIWHARLARNPYGSEGFLSMTYRGVELVAPDLWDEVSGIWFALVELVEEFVGGGADRGSRAEKSFPGQPVPLRLARDGTATLFTVGRRTQAVDPKEFLPGLLDEAARYVRWTEEHVGTGEAGMLPRIESARAAAVARFPPTGRG